MTKVSVNAPRTPVTEGSSGLATATLPNMCKMPGPPAPFVPTPLPNIGKSGSSPKDYSKTVTIEGKKVAIRGATFGSMGDVASKGTGGGLVSANVEGPTSFAGPGSMDVKVEGKNVQLLGDPMLNNCGPSGSPANSATLMGVIQVTGWMVTLVTGEEECPLCKEAHKSKSALKETDKTRADAKQLAKTLSKHNKGAAQAKKFPQGKHDSGKMLGAVRCICDQTYADHSGGTEQVFRELVKKELGWHVPQESGVKTNIAVLNEETGEKENRVVTKAEAFTRKLYANDPERFKALQAEWNRADRLFEDYDESKDQDPTLPVRFPPGRCAGPKALALALEDGAVLSGITERWFHSGKGRTDGMVEHLRSDWEAPITKSFGHGESVPPCGSCNIVLPLMLCSKGKKGDRKCQHKKRKE